MAEQTATWAVRLIGFYLVIGLGFALGFAWRGAGRLDPAARTGTPGFRLLLLPGATLLWPWLGHRLLEARKPRP